MLHMFPTYIFQNNVFFTTLRGDADNNDSGAYIVMRKIKNNGPIMLRTKANFLGAQSDNMLYKIRERKELDTTNFHFFLFPFFTAFANHLVPCVFRQLPQSVHPYTSEYRTTSHWGCRLE